jgi:hypothetical protein
MAALVDEAIEPGSTVHTDGWVGYDPLKGRGFVHEISFLKGKKESTSELMPHVHRIASLLQYHNRPHSAGLGLSKPPVGFLRFGVRAAQIGGCYVIRGASRRPTRSRIIQAGLYRQGEPPPADAGIIRQQEVQHQADWLELGARRFEGRERHRSASRRAGRCQ